MALPAPAGPCAYWTQECGVRGECMNPPAGMPVSAGIDEAELTARVGEVLYHWPVAGLAAGVIRGGSLAWFCAHGLASIEAGTPVGADTVFRIASVTKTMTAIAVMQLREQGLVDLDAPASEYLRAYRLVPARASFRCSAVGPAVG
jgi:CubicO group peptidase (beta-lactamase class C family)